ncbi:GNAT family N-acetyltransferase [Baekduia soli]|uniref:GNAT family N-acetyltransferase n=1 Tax=Baekduia soli TaxID=496014 RepID=A0A5B8U9K4_9ACTN|nr:GNAT family N-acetyltransferase [Baekduia soli]QEC49478.1 GNAT family N-acetyltransferase [Baekduia soli]
MDDAVLMSRMFASLRGTLRTQAQGGASGLELDGVTAAVTAATPGRSVMNAAVAASAGALEAGYDALAQAYADAGVYAWTVWVDSADRATADVLAARGHVLDAEPAGMAIELADLGDGPPEPAWTGDWGALADALAVNDEAYGDTQGKAARALGALPEGAAHLYLAHHEGRPASFVIVRDHGEDLHFWVAATIPVARGRGLLSGLLHRALRDARDRGLTTSTTQATRMGAPVYERLGYRTIRPVQMWERRGAG